MQTWELRTEFARRLSLMYGEEVPAYKTLVEVSTEVNADYRRRHGEDAERLGSIDRVTAERHGAIRVGTREELRDAGRLFRALGMHPVGFYDLRDASPAPVPVVSTAFRPTGEELAKNPFRVFTSMLAVDDSRFFDAALRDDLESFLAQRTLFDPELLELADHASEHDGLTDHDGARFLDLAVATFVLSDKPISEAWYRRLEHVSAVAADIGGVESTHINHLTPRVLDIDALYRAMEDRGIEMIDEVQGPPQWEGPDILLRQTSFRALSEMRTFAAADGSTAPGGLRVRFGEVEQRGIAVTPAGRRLYDEMTSEVERLVSEEGRPDRKPEIAEQVWRDRLPATEAGPAEAELGYFTYEAAPDAKGDTTTGMSLAEAVERGAVRRVPIVYEDFLPKSAAGIFQSNLDGQGSRDESGHGADYDIDDLAEIIGREVVEPTDLYAAQQQASIDDVTRALGLR